MTPHDDFVRGITRRHFFASTGFSLGTAALTSLFARAADKTGHGAALPETHFPAKAKHVIYLHMVGGPPQMDLFDYKPRLREWYDKELPASVRGNQRLTTMTSGQARFPIAPSKFSFQRHGKVGMWLTELLPNLGQVADEICF